MVILGRIARHIAERVGEAGRRIVSRWTGNRATRRDRAECWRRGSGGKEIRRNWATPFHEGALRQRRLPESDACISCHRSPRTFALIESVTFGIVVADEAKPE